MKSHPSDQSSMIRTEDGSAFHTTTNWIMAVLLQWVIRPTDDAGPRGG